MEVKNQSLRDYRLSVEYGYLQDNAPAGVLLLPDMGNMRSFHGTIFVRTGSYKGGVFRFRMVLPEMYNAEGSFPEVIFTPPVFHPLVDSNTGKMTLYLHGELMRKWDPSKHFLSTALSCAKKIFHLQSYEQIPFDEVLPNERARELFEHDRASFLREVAVSVDRASAESINHKASEETGNQLRFSEPLPAHDFLRETVLGQLLASRERELKQLLSAADGGNKEDEGNSGDDSDSGGATRDSRTRRDSVTEARQTLTRVRASSSSSSLSSDKKGVSTPITSPKSPSPNSKNRRLRSFFDAPLGGSMDDGEGSPQGPPSTLSPTAIASSGV